MENPVSPEEKKALKAEYDRLYRLKNKETLRVKKSAFAKSESGRAMQKRQREKRKQYHNEYCRNPEQRLKEKQRRHIREGKLGFKHCIVCATDKNVLDFQSWHISDDGRSYICKSCEKKHKEEYGCSTRNVLTSMVGRDYTSLTRRDLIKHPYLIEANKFLILLKQLTNEKRKRIEGCPR